MGGQEARCIAVVRVRHRASQDILRAIEADNVVAPPWLSIDCRDLGELLECIVEVDCSTPSRILSLRNTLDELLRAIRVAVETIEGLESVKKA